MNKYIIGERVATSTSFPVSNSDGIPAGARGHVVETFEERSPVSGKFETQYMVFLDTHYPCLDEWDNCLHVYGYETDDGREISATKQLREVSP